MIALKRTDGRLPVECQYQLWHDQDAYGRTGNPRTRSAPKMAGTTTTIRLAHALSNRGGLTKRSTKLLFPTADSPVEHHQWLPTMRPVRSSLSLPIGIPLRDKERRGLTYLVGRV